MFFNQTFVLYHDSGNIEIVEDLIAYIRAVGYPRFHATMKFNVGEYKRTRDLYGTPGWYDSYALGRANYCDNHFGFFLCTEKGIMISPDLLTGEYEKWYSSYAFNWRTAYAKRMWNRQGTTSHTRTGDKHPTNQQARRMAVGVVKEDGEPEFRGSRRNLNSWWDEVQVRRSCSWKNCTKRKKQYKGS